MRSSASLRTLRLIHLYLGVFVAPALIFFAFTGALQTFSLHESSRGSTYIPPRWAVVIAQIHKKQIAVVPERKPAPNRPAQGKVLPMSVEGAAPPYSAGNAAARPASAAASSVPASPQLKHHPLPLKIFFLLVCILLVTSTLTGIAMAYKYKRGPLVIAGLLLAGIVIPLVLIAV